MKPSNATGPVTDHPFTCNLCEAMCGLRVTVEDNRVTQLRGDPADVLSRGHICPKAFALRELLEDPDRLRNPVRRTKSGWERISWDDALFESARRLGEVRSRYGKDAVAYYLGNPTVHSHRASMGAQLFSTTLGTKNRFDANSQDANPRIFAALLMYGDALALPVPDVDRTDYMLLLGANPAASNGSLMTLGDVRTRMAAVTERGGKVVLVDPRRTETAAWCTRHHFIRPAGDAALCMAILHVMFAEELLDLAAVRRIANGISELGAIAARFPPDRVAPAIGIHAEEIRVLARELAAAPRACVYSRVGTCQNEFGSVASWLVEVLNVVTGNFDREGGVMFPTPAADVGPIARAAVGNHWGRWRSRLRGLPELLGSLPAAVMAEEMETPGEGQIRAFVCFAGNPVSSTPNGERLSRALGKLDFVLAVDLFVNETSRHADIILPPKHVFENGSYDLLLSRFVVRNAAKYSAPILRTNDDTRDDWTIMSELSFRLAIRNSARAGKALRTVVKSVPEHTVDALLRLGPYGLSLSKLRDTAGGVDLGPLRPSGGRAVRTVDGKVALTPSALTADVSRLERWVDERRAHDLVLIGRRHVRSNNSWLHNAKSLVKGPDRSRLMMNPRDAERLGLRDGGEVRVSSRVGAVRVSLAVTSDMMPGVVSLPHGFGQAEAGDTLHVAGKLAGASMNVLTDDAHVEGLIGSAVLSGVPVRVERVDAGAAR